MALMLRAEELAKRNRYNPFEQNFDEANSVESRIARIARSDSPLMQLAATRADQEMAARGLRKSTLGVQAGQQAIIQAAAPIANADASLIQQQRLANQDVRNLAARENAAREANFGMEGLRLDQSEGQFVRQFGENQRQFDASQGLNREQMALQDRQFGQKIGLETADQRLRAEQAQAQREQFAQQFGLSTRELEARNAQVAADQRLRSEQLAAQKEQFAQQFGLNSRELDLQRDRLGAEDRRFYDQLTNQRSMFDRELGSKESQFARQQEQQRTLAQMDVAAREKMAGIEAQYKTQIQGDLNISNAWGTVQDQISKIQNNPELDQGAKQTLISNTMDSFKSFTSFWNKLGSSRVDVSDLLNFAPAAAGGGAASRSGGGAAAVTSTVQDMNSGYAAPGYYGYTAPAGFTDS